jgi:hypothetical protein
VGAVLAYSDVRKFFNDSGQLRPVSEWTEEMAAAVAA